MEILIIDDSESDAMILEEAVSATGWKAHIHNAWDGEQALAYLHHEGPYEREPHPDLIILDLNMPRKNGFEVLDEIRQDPALAKVPVMVLTTSHAEDDILTAFEHGADSYLTKPTGYADVPNLAREMHVFWFHHGVRP